MLVDNQMLGYIPANTVIHQLNSTAKLLFLLLVSIACMTTYDTRLLAFMAVFSFVLFKLADIKWQQVSFVIKFIAVFSLLNIFAIYLFAPEYGVTLYGTRTLIWKGINRFTLTYEELFYEFNLILKYFCTIPLALIFLLTTNPSEFASSLNRLGVHYKISYAVALAIRYIPDIQEDFFNISLAQQARGLELSKKGQLIRKLKGSLQIVFPLILSSLDRIETISTAMELRRFGENKRRTWYIRQPIRLMDGLVILSAIIFLLVSFYLFHSNNGRFYNPFR